MGKGNFYFEQLSKAVNDQSDYLPKGRSSCFDIGSNGGCGVDCAEFCRGGCGEPQEISAIDVIDEHGIEEGVYILEFYDCFDSYLIGDLDNG